VQKQVIFKVYSSIKKAVQSNQRSSVLPIRNLCYTGFGNMQTKIIRESRSAWHDWAGLLHHFGLENLVAWVLEAAGPLTVLGAQALYLGGPLLRPGLTDKQLDALTGLLEDRDETLAFTAFLREELSL
jgi:hypothetical protein